MDALKSTTTEGRLKVGLIEDHKLSVYSEEGTAADANTEDRRASTTDESGDENEEPAHNEFTKKRRCQNAKFEELSVSIAFFFF